MYQIGSDGGLMQKTVPIERLSLFPAERADLIIDFSDYAGQTIILKNDLGPNAQPDDETGDIMQFRVTKPLSEPDTSRIPNILSEIPSLTNNPIQTLRYVKLTGSTDEFGRPLLLLDNKSGWFL